MTREESLRAPLLFDFGSVQSYPLNTFGLLTAERSGGIISSVSPTYWLTDCLVAQYIGRARRC